MTGTDISHVKQAMSTLSRTERYVVLMYFADELTFSEIALVLDLSPPRVEHIIDAFRSRIATNLTASDQQQATQSYLSNYLASRNSAFIG